MAILNFILQGKGGVGKSYAASLLAQHLLDREIKTQCFDTDPVNATFASYKAYNVERVELIENGNINPQYFDNFIIRLLEAPENSQVIIDNGASSFLPLCSYMTDNDIIMLLESHGHSIRFHSVISGGQAMLDTLGGLKALLENFENIPVIVWQNEYFGKVELDGIRIENTRLFNDYGNRIHALIDIPAVFAPTFGFNVNKMLEKRLTFKDAIKSIEFDVMAKHRLGRVWRDLNQNMVGANL